MFLPLITLVVLCSISCIIVVARTDIRTAAATNRAAAIYSNLIFSREFNNNERNILCELYSMVSIQPDLSRPQTSVHSKLIYYLKEYLGSTGIDLGSPEAQKISNRIHILNRIFLLEDNRDIVRMTLDAKGIAINTMQEIYQLCGLNLTFDLKGDIEKITGPDGTVIYQSGNQIQKAGFHIGALLITVSLIILLLTMITVIVKRRQLAIISYGAYDTSDEEKFMQEA